MFDDEMMTIEDVAAYLKLKPQTIYKWAQTGRIPGAKFGKEWRFRRSTIEEWIDDLIATQSGYKSESRVASDDLKRDETKPGEGKAGAPAATGDGLGKSRTSDVNADDSTKKGGGPEKN